MRDAVRARWIEFTEPLEVVIRLTREGMSDIALAKLDENDEVLKSRFPEWEDLPACAQLALHSLSWACGARFNFPKLMSAVHARDFDAAAIHVAMNETTPEGIFNGGLVARNVRNRILMINAARVEAFRLDPDLLDWTHDLSVMDADTHPEIDNPSSEPPPLP